MTTLEGIVERVVYTNEDTLYEVFRMKVRGFREPVTVAGKLPPVLPGEEVTVEGEWGRHPKHGPQFQAQGIKQRLPAGPSAIQKYLASGLIKGIGKVMAGRLVDAFGAETLDIIDHQPARITEVSGIGTMRAASIVAAWETQKAIRDVMMFLHECGVAGSLAVKLYKQYGLNAAVMVQKHPYRLAMEVRGIGFKTADRIAQKVGVEKDSLERAQAGIFHCLHEWSSEGHTYSPEETLLTAAKELLGVEEALLKEALVAMEGERIIAPEDCGEVRAIFLKGYQAAEKGIAYRFRRLLSQPRSYRDIKVDKALEWVQEELHITLAEKQEEAVAGALQSKVFIITGGPGTGKTTIIRCILAILEKLKVRIALAAPTGRAAKRITETTGRFASTLHRLLKFDPSNGGFAFDERHPLPADILIVDEVSMVDTPLMYHLLKALSPKTTLILVGDSNQLPSVGPGNVLQDCLRSGVVPSTELSEVFRQAQRSLIVRNAHRINEGQFPFIPPKKEIQEGKPEEDFFFVARENPEDCLRLILHLVTERIPKVFGIPADQVQVLSPMHNGTLGTHNLNHALQDALNPHGTEHQRGGTAYRVGDRVMQLRNNYDKDVFNGDIGRIVALNEDQRELMVDFDGEKVLYDFSDLDELALAYAISVHKSQGSEYPAVVIPISTQHYMLLKRNLLYTAVTRARKLVVLAGTQRALGIAVSRVDQAKRLTWLAVRLKDPGAKLEDEAFAQQMDLW